MYLIKAPRTDYTCINLVSYRNATDPHHSDQLAATCRHSKTKALAPQGKSVDDTRITGRDVEQLFCGIMPCLTGRRVKDMNRGSKGLCGRSPSSLRRVRGIGHSWGSHDNYYCGKRMIEEIARKEAVLVRGH